jgi:hypothetical protein
MESNQSEVARLKEQIAAEQESANRALSSFAYGAAQHRFITRRLENIGKAHDELRGIVGDEADRMLVEAMQRGS